MQDEILAGEFDGIQGEPGGVDGDVIGEEIGQDAEATRAFDAELARPGPRLRLDRDIAPLDAEPAGDLGALRGRESCFEACAAPGVLDDRRTPEAGGRLSRGRHQPQAQSWGDAAVLDRIDLHGRIMLAQHGDDPAIAHDGVALQRAGRRSRGDGGPIIPARQRRRFQRPPRRTARVPDGDASPRRDRGGLRRIGRPRSHPPSSAAREVPRRRRPQAGALGIPSPRIPSRKPRLLLDPDVPGRTLPGPGIDGKRPIVTQPRVGASRAVIRTGHSPVDREVRADGDCAGRGSPGETPGAGPDP